MMPLAQRANLQHSGTYIGGHDGGFLEVNSFLLRLDHGNLRDGHVRESNQLGGDNQLDRVGGLGSRLIPAGEGASRNVGLMSTL